MMLDVNEYIFHHSTTVVHENEPNGICFMLFSRSNVINETFLFQTKNKKRHVGVLPLPELKSSSNPEMLNSFIFVSSLAGLVYYYYYYYYSTTVQYTPNQIMQYSS